MTVAHDRLARQPTTVDPCRRHLFRARVVITGRESQRKSTIGADQQLEVLWSLSREALRRVVITQPTQRRRPANISRTRGHIVLGALKSLGVGVVNDRTQVIRR